MGYGDPAALDDYQGGRDLNSLSSFAKENLKPVCSLQNIDLCDDEKKAQIESLKSKSVDDLKGMISTEEGKLDAAEEEFKAEEEKEAEVKSSGLGLMKAVLKAKESGSDELY